MHINKQQFEDWQSPIIKAFYKKGKNKGKSGNKSNDKTKGKNKGKKENTKTKKNKSNDNNISLPTNNNPLYAFKNKVVLAIDFLDKDNKPLSSYVDTAKQSKLPKKHNIKLYHVGYNKLDNVAIGVNEHSRLIYPALDLGGLTYITENLTPYSKKLSFVPEKHTIDSNTKVTDVEVNKIYNKWLSLTKKKQFYEFNKADLKKFLDSVSKYLKANHTKYNGANLRFHKLPKEYRVIVTSADVQKLTGNYYQRIFGKGDQNHAKKIQPKSTLYCGITNTYITPNLNKKNILNEYI